MLTVPPVPNELSRLPSLLNRSRTNAELFEPATTIRPSDWAAPRSLVRGK